MRLASGLKIYLDKGIRNRILLSDGVQRVDSLNGVECKSPTYIPKKPWRTPSREDLEVLFATKKDLSGHQTIGIVQLPRKLNKGFKKIDLSVCKNHSEVHSITGSTAYKTLLNDTINYYEQFATIKNSSIPHNIYMGEANLINNTFNQKEKTFIGLHLDSFERNSETRDAARNRICINLGKQPRYLLFYNLQFDQMAQMCGMKTVGRNDNPYTMLYDFFERFNTYPVIKIQINPYEAYIAPTENMIHDGSTEGTTALDINLASLFTNLFKI
jgi:hypothetical protein